MELGCPDIKNVPFLAELRQSLPQTALGKLSSFRTSSAASLLAIAGSAGGFACTSPPTGATRAAETPAAETRSGENALPSGEENRAVGAGAGPSGGSQGEASAAGVEPGGAHKNKGSPARSFVEERFPGTSFPPQDPGPAFERTGKPGDGVWGPMFESVKDEDKKAEKGPSERNPDNLGEHFGEAYVRRMVLHPHETSPFPTLTLAAFDLAVLSLHHRPGQADAEEMGFTDLAKVAGLVPEQEQPLLRALFNEGFQPRHGRWGLLTLGEQVVPPRVDGCTVAVMKDGTALILPWPEMEKRLSEVVAYRQTPPCLVAAGARHPKLDKGDRAAWAGQNEKLKTRRRSAVGISADGRTLIYGLGNEAEPEVLAAGMLHAGAKYAAELDINWNWTRLFLFEAQPEGESSPEKVRFVGAVRYVGALEKDMARDRGEYLVRQGKRGFFFLLARDPSTESPTGPSSGTVPTHPAR